VANVWGDSPSLSRGRERGAVGVWGEIGGGQLFLRRLDRKGGHPPSFPENITLSKKLETVPYLHGRRKKKKASGCEKMVDRSRGRNS